MQAIPLHHVTSRAFRLRLAASCSYARLIHLPLQIYPQFPPTYTYTGPTLHPSFRSTKPPKITRARSRRRLLLTFSPGNAGDRSDYRSTDPTHDALPVGREEAHEREEGQGGRTRQKRESVEYTESSPLLEIGYCEMACCCCWSDCRTERPLGEEEQKDYNRPTSLCAVSVLLSLSKNLISAHGVLSCISVDYKDLGTRGVLDWASRFHMVLSGYSRLRMCP